MSLFVLKIFLKWRSKVSDPHWFNADPEPGPVFFLISGPDPGRFCELNFKFLKCRSWVSDPHWFNADQDPGSRIFSNLRLQIRIRIEVSSVNSICRESILSNFFLVPLWVLLPWVPVPVKKCQRHFYKYFKIFFKILSAIHTPGSGSSNSN